MNLSHALVLAAVSSWACHRSPAPTPQQHLVGQLPDTFPALRGSLSAISSFSRAADSGGHRRLHIVNRRFLLTRLYHRYEGASHPLIRETVDQECCLDGERDTYATITLEGWVSAAQAGPQPGWYVQVDADEGTMWGDFYRAVLFGCCDQTDARTYVNLQTGKVTFQSSRPWRDPDSDIPHLSVPNAALGRWAGFLDTYTPIDLPEAKTDSGVIGILQYGDGEQPAHRFVLRQSVGPGFMYRLGSVEFTVDDKTRTHGEHVYLWAGDGKEDPSALSGFWITVALIGLALADREVPDVILNVPVVADTVRLERAQLPPGWSFRATAHN